MPIQLQILLIALSLLVLCSILHFLITRHFSERDSILWFFIIGICVFFGFFPRTLVHIAHFVGVDYPPTLLFLLAILLLFGIVFKQSLDISRLKDENRELISHLSLLHSQSNPVRPDAAPDAPKAAASANDRLPV